MGWRIREKLKVVWRVFVVAGDKDVHDLIEEVLGGLMVGE